MVSESVGREVSGGEEDGTFREVGEDVSGIVPEVHVVVLIAIVIVRLYLGVTTCIHLTTWSSQTAYQTIWLQVKSILME